MTIINEYTSSKVILIVLLLIFVMSDLAKADEGCAMNVNNSSSEIVYTVRSGSVSGRRNFIGPISYNDIGFPSACPRYGYSAAVVENERCAINGVYNSSYRILTFTPLNCPIDDYMLYLVFLMGGIGFFYLCKGKFLLFS